MMSGKLQNTESKTSSSNNPAIYSMYGNNGGNAYTHSNIPMQTPYQSQPMYFQSYLPPMNGSIHPMYYNHNYNYGHNTCTQQPLPTTNNGPITSNTNQLQLSNNGSKTTNEKTIVRQRFHRLSDSEKQKLFQYYSLNKLESALQFYGFEQTQYSILKTLIKLELEVNYSNVNVNENCNSNNNSIINGNYSDAFHYNTLNTSTNTGTKTSTNHSTCARDSNRNISKGAMPAMPKLERYNFHQTVPKNELLSSEVNKPLFVENSGQTGMPKIENNSENACTANYNINKNQNIANTAAARVPSKTDEKINENLQNSQMSSATSSILGNNNNYNNIRLNSYSDRNSNSERSVANAYDHTCVERVYTCKRNKCNRTFKNKAALLSHMMIEHKHKHKHSYTQNKLTFECNVCHKRFLTQLGLSKHNSMVHNGEKQVICVHCTRKFKNQSGLINHLRFKAKSGGICPIPTVKKMDGKKYTCGVDTCTHEPFSSLKRLNNHKQTKHNVKI